MLLLFSLTAALSVTDRSFWIDEALTAELASQATLADCWRGMRSLPEIQLPLFMLYTWSYAHTFGTQEWVLRFAGVPWFLFGAITFGTALGFVVRQRWIPALLVSSSAFVWYYLNEARVYSMQLGLTLALAGFASHLLRSSSNGQFSRRHGQWFLLCFFLLCATSVLAAMWATALFLIFFMVLSRTQWVELWRRTRRSAIVCIIGLVILSAYYAWTMTLHARPTAVGTTTPQTIIFVFYELLGAAGLGPGRNELRASGARAVWPFAGLLIPFAVVSVAVLWAGLKAIGGRWGRKRLFLGLSIAASPLALLCMVGVATRFRVLGRHATPLLVLLWIVLAFGTIHLWHAHSRFSKSISAMFIALCLVSSLSIRFAPRHEKDDYRSAATFAREAAANGEHVWWNADVGGGSHYGVMGSATSGASRVLFLANPASAQLESLPEPSVVITSKPDIYDSQGALVTYLRERQFQIATNFPAFAVWIKGR